MGSMLLKVICGTMFLLGMSWNVMAKEVIKGRVVDSQSKEVLIGATVSVEGTSVGCATDAEGYFELEVEESGTVILVFRCVGYSEVKKSVVVDDKKVDLGTVGMLPMYINLSDVVVRGSLARGPEDPGCFVGGDGERDRGETFNTGIPGDIEIFAECLCHERGGSVWRWTD